MLYIAVGAALMLAIVLAIVRPSTAQGILESWQCYKEALFLLIGALTTFYFLSSGVWYLILLGAGGIMFIVWALWFSEPLKPITGWAR